MFLKKRDKLHVALLWCISAKRLSCVWQQYSLCPMNMTLFTTLMTELVRTSETSVYSNETTLRYIPEGSNI
jgi:hypothetical protein